MNNFENDPKKGKNAVVIDHEKQAKNDALLASNPKRYRELKNGAIIDNTTGRFVAAPPAHRQSITGENASALAHRRWELGRDAAEIGLRDLKPGLKTQFEAWSKIVKAQAELAIDTKQGRASTEAAGFVGRATDLLPGNAKMRQETPGSGVKLLISGEIAQKIVETLANLPNQS